MRVKGSARRGKGPDFLLIYQILRPAVLFRCPADVDGIAYSARAYLIYVASLSMNTVLRQLSSVAGNNGV